ncbi:MAG: trypsin-like serine protease [Sphingomonas sp.]
MPCPDGLNRGFGLSSPEATALCLTKSYFGIVGGDSLYVSGSALLFLEGGRRYVLTAGHNLFSHRAGRMAVWFDVWFRRVGDVSLASRQTTQLYVPDEFQNANVAGWDFGVARLKSAVEEDRFNPIGLGLSDSDETLLRISGYPNEDACQGKHLPYYADLTATAIDQNNYGYRAQATYEGMSGGPLLHKEPSGEICSYGIHIRGGSGPRAVRFSQPVRDRILGWV